VNAAAAQHKKFAGAEACLVAGAHLPALDTFGQQIKVTWVPVDYRWRDLKDS